jgi:hypothetical protein
MSEKKLRICYHGTKKENVFNIIQYGFNKNTWFAKHLEDALAFGGNYVFGVILPDEAFIRKGQWQVMINNPVSPDKIVSLKKYEIEAIHKDYELMDKVLKSNRDE